MTNKNEELLGEVIKLVEEHSTNKPIKEGIEHLVHAFRLIKEKTARKNILESMALAIDAAKIGESPHQEVMDKLTTIKI